MMPHEREENEGAGKIQSIETTFKRQPLHFVFSCHFDVIVLPAEDKVLKTISVHTTHDSCLQR